MPTLVHVPCPGHMHMRRSRRAKVQHRSRAIAASVAAKCNNRCYIRGLHAAHNASCKDPATNRALARQSARAAHARCRRRPRTLVWTAHPVAALTRARAHETCTAQKLSARSQMQKQTPVKLVKVEARYAMFPPAPRDLARLKRLSPGPAQEMQLRAVMRSRVRSNGCLTSAHALGTEQCKKAAAGGAVAVGRSTLPPVRSTHENA